MAETPAPVCPATVCHVEFAVRDLEAAQRFYGRLFAWKFREFGPTMVAFGTDDEHIGGLQLSQDVFVGESPSVWFRVAAIDPLLETAVLAGGSVIAPKHDLPGVGWSAQVADPDGNRIGLVQYAA